MKTSWLVCLGLLILSLLTKESEAHMAMLYPTPRGGFGTKAFDWRIHTFIGYKGLKYPCGGYPKGPNTSKSTSHSCSLFFPHFHLHHRHLSAHVRLLLPPFPLPLLIPLPFFASSSSSSLTNVF